MASQPMPVENEERGMDDSELVSLLQAHEMSAIGFFDSEIASEQAQAIDYYYGRMDDLPQIEGCSGAVEHIVQVQVDNALAAVLKPFVSSDETVRFNARGPEDEAQAEQATEYVNYVVNQDNPGFLIFHNWFKDALFTKLGIVKVWWEDKTTHEVQETVTDALGVLDARNAENYHGETEHEDGTYRVQHLVSNPDGRVKIENIPPEEFLIVPYARSIDCEYVAHRPTNFTRSDLVEMGIDPEIAAELPAYSSGKAEETRRQARYRDENWNANGRVEQTSDPARDVLAILDEYVRADYNGDGVAELRRVVRVNDIILINEEVDDCPFATLCPIPMPHKVYGRSIADLAIEEQRIGTAVKRQTLDNLYKTNNPRPIVNELGATQTTFEDLADTAPGAGVRVKSAGAIEWMAVPFTAQHSIPMMEIIAQSAEERTGFQRKGNGLNPEALEKNSPDTATQAQLEENSRTERAEMIARIFAETGVTRLFKLVLKLLVAHQPKERMIRLRNQWVPVDPRGWNADMDLTISVGLGVGNRQEQMAQADAVLTTMQMLQQTPYAYLVNAEKVHNALKRKFTAAGIKNVDDYLIDPRQTTPPPPQPSPEMAKMQMEGQARAAELQHKQQLSAIDLQNQQAISAAKIQLMQQETAAQLQLQREKHAQEMQVARERMVAEAELEREKLMMEAGLRVNDQAHSHAMEAANMTENRPGGDLDK